MARQIIKNFANVNSLLTVSPTPVWRTQRTAEETIQAILLSLLPVFLLAIIHFGLGAIRVTAMSVGVSIATWLVCEKVTRRSHPIGVWYAALSGVLFAFVLPASVPWWLVSIGAICSIGLGSIAFGGVGSNPFCTPLVGWAICKMSWPKHMDINLSMLDTTLTSPLSQLKYSGFFIDNHVQLWDLFLGRQLGGLGAVQVVAVLTAGIFLLFRRYIRIYAPLGFLLGVGGLSLVYWLIDGSIYPRPLFQLLAGQVLFGAFFLVTDWGSTPVGRLQTFIFGLVAGVLVVIIRVYGVYPDGVAFAVLLANLLTPIIDMLRFKPAICGKGGRV